MINGECTHVGRIHKTKGKVTVSKDWKDFKASFPPFLDYCSDEVIDFFIKWLAEKNRLKVDWFKPTPPTKIKDQQGPYDPREPAVPAESPYYTPMEDWKIPLKTWMKPQKFDADNITSVTDNNNNGECPLCN